MTAAMCDSPCRVTGDNLTTARAIAIECGIIQSDQDLVIEGPKFRRMTPAQVDEILPRLKVGSLPLVTPFL